MTPDLRIVLTDGIHNFRDYGGYPARDGMRLATGRLFRSAQHLDASDADLERLQAMGVDTFIDLRGNSERELYPCRRHRDFAGRVVFADGETTNPAVLPLAPGMSEADVQTRMVATYTDLAFRPKLIEALRHYFAALATSEGASIVHCLAGKDRTGLAVGLFHRLLGVAQDDVIADYLLTNRSGDIDARVEAGAKTIRERVGETIPEPVLRALMGVHESWLDAAFGAIESEHGSVEAYAETLLGLDPTQREALAERYLVTA